MCYYAWHHAALMEPAKPGHGYGLERAVADCRQLTCQCFRTLSCQSAQKKNSIFDHSSNACVLVCMAATCCQGLDARAIASKGP